MNTSDALEHTAPRLADRFRDEIRAQNLTPRTEYSYRHWISRYVFFHDLKSPEMLGERDVRKFLSYLATVLNASQAKRNQARSALDFLYSRVLNRPLGQD